MQVQNISFKGHLNTKSPVLSTAKTIVSTTSPQVDKIYLDESLKALNNESNNKWRVINVIPDKIKNKKGVMEDISNSKKVVKEPTLGTFFISNEGKANEKFVHLHPNGDSYHFEKQDATAIKDSSLMQSFIDIKNKLGNLTN